MTIKNIKITSNKVVDDFNTGCRNFYNLLKGNILGVSKDIPIVSITHYHNRCNDGSVANVLFTNLITDIFKEGGRNTLQLNIPHAYSKSPTYSERTQDITWLYETSKRDPQTALFVINYVDFFPCLDQVIDTIRVIEENYGFLEAGVLRIQLNIIDHHSIPEDVRNELFDADLAKYGVEHLNVLFDGDNDHCGAMIVYNLSKRERTPYYEFLMDMIDGRDRFKQTSVVDKYNNQEELSKDLYFLQKYKNNMNPDIFYYGVSELTDSMDQDKLDSLYKKLFQQKNNSSQIISIMENGQKIIDRQKWAIDALINNAVKIKQNPYTGGMYALVENSNSLITSNLGRDICLKYGEEITFVAIYNINSDTGGVDISFRSMCDDIASHIAVNEYSQKYHNGGGHKAAAGCGITWDEFYNTYILGSV